MQPEMADAFREDTYARTTASSSPVQTNKLTKVIKRTMAISDNNNIIQK